MQPHEKIIADTARSVLVPEGLFRKGSSRVWLEDHGFYLIQVEFQPSAYAKGAYLNVGVSFLFRYTDGLNEMLSYNLGGRMAEFIEYQDDESFRREIEQYAEKVMEKVREYRKIESFEAAGEALQKQIQNKGEDRFCWEMYELALLNYLSGDWEEGNRMLSVTMESLDRNYVWGRHTTPWLAEVYDICENCLTQCVTRESAQKMVENMINQRRAYFMSKASFKKMKGTYTASELK